MRLNKFLLVIFVLVGSIFIMPIRAEEISAKQVAVRIFHDPDNPEADVDEDSYESLASVGEVTGIKLNKTKKTVYLFTTYQLTPIIQPSDATDQSVTWSSSDDSIATVSSTGEVYGVAKGKATITATTVNGKTAKCKVTVKVKKVKSVKLNYKTKTMYLNKTYQLDAKIKPLDATYQTITWKSTKPSVATVDEFGLVTPVSDGTCYIKAKAANGKSAKVKVTVKLRSYFSSHTGTASENKKALKAALEIIAEKGWVLDGTNEFELAQEIADYVANSIYYSTARNRWWTAYAGLVRKEGSCWAYAHAYLFLAKEVGLDVKTVAVRKKEMKSGWFDVYDYFDRTYLGGIGFGIDHMAIQFNYKGQPIYIETQCGEMFIVEDDIYYYLGHAPF